VDGPIFRETQRFTSRWVALLVALMAAGALAPLAFALVDRRPLLADPGFLFGIIAPAVLGAGIVFLMVTCRLETEIRPDGITYRFFPFHLGERRIGWGEIASCRIRTYRPIVEYGGWGLRRGRGGRGLACNVKGNTGLQLELIDGRKILLGTQMPDEMEKALAAAGAPLGPRRRTIPS
jgi:hypothetical protein